MARAALREKAPDQTQAADDDVSTRALSPHEVLDYLEPVSSDDISRAPRGIIYGAICGALIWVLLVGAVLLFR